MLTAERLRTLLDYDPATGIFRWRLRRGPSAAAGAIAGRVAKSGRHVGGGYRIIGVDGAEFYAHRLAMLYVTGKWPSDEVDHRNLSRDDNRIDNLRDATRSQNLCNRRPLAGSASGLKGTYFHKASGRWRAVITRAGRSIHLGLFDSAEEAHAAYSAAAQRLFGEFSRVS